MIAPTFVLAIMLVAQASADVEQAGPVESVAGQAQAVPVHHVVVASNQPEPHHQVVGSSPVVHEHHHKQQEVLQHHQIQHQQHQPQYYAVPSGLIQPVGSGEQQYGGAAQQPILKHYSGASGPAVAAIAAPSAEQYGQPESASIPPNYKPFGSWGLYIGGNPADGYYSSYYKALGQSVADKQQQVAPSDSYKPAGVGQASGAQPLLKQAFTNYHQQDQGYAHDPASSSPYYTPADLNSGARVPVAAHHGGQYGPAVYNYVEQPSVSGLSYAPSNFGPAPEQYASTKRSSSLPHSSYATKSRDVTVQVPQAPVKGYQQQQQQQQQGYYSYAAGVPAFVYQSPVVEHQQQVVAYPVPVGSQIVGSQPGVESSFAPFGVHGFTRYAIKPTVVDAAPAPVPAAGVHSAPVSQFPVYKQVVGYQQPLSFYGYPLSQLHYSQGSSALLGHQQGSQVESGVSSAAAAAPPCNLDPSFCLHEASSEKSESTVVSKPAAAAAAAPAAPVQPANNSNSKPTTTQ